MSSILDALEKANRERHGQTTGSGVAGRLAADSARERRLREEAESQKRILRVAVVLFIALLLVMAGLVSWVVMRTGSPASSPSASLPTVTAPRPIPAQPAGSSAPVPTATPVATATPAPTPTPITIYVTATPAPAVATPAPTPSAQPTPEPTLATPTPRFVGGQEVSASDLGLRIEGVMMDGDYKVAIINGQDVMIGKTIKGCKLLTIDSGKLEFEVEGAKVLVLY